MDICSLCNNSEFITTIEDKTFVIKGQEVNIKNYTSHLCKSCGQTLIDEETLQITRAFLKDTDETLDKKFLL